jgi:hypothetical protein
VLSELAWQTHWRIKGCTLAGGILAVLAWRSFFPNAFWFVWLWAGITSGAFAGFLIGALWQVGAAERRRYTSGRVLASIGLPLALLAAASFFFLGPDLLSQETKLAQVRALSAEQVSSIVVVAPTQAPRIIQSKAAIASFASLAKHAELFYPSHEGSALEFEITVHLKSGGAVSFHARVPERHQEDVGLQFHGYVSWSEIIIPGGRAWLREVSQDARR